MQEFRQSKKRYAIIAIFSCLFFMIWLPNPILVVYGQEEKATITAPSDVVSVTPFPTEILEPQPADLIGKYQFYSTTSPTVQDESNVILTKTSQSTPMDFLSQSSVSCLAETCSRIQTSLSDNSEISFYDFVATSELRPPNKFLAIPTLISEFSDDEDVIIPSLGKDMENCAVNKQQNALRSNLIVKFSREGYALVQDMNLFTDLPLISLDQINSVIVSVPIGEVETLTQMLQSNNEVIYVEPDSEIVAVDLIPSDPGVVNQYYLDYINAFSGWDLSTGVSSTVIAILDTGVDLTHVELVDKLLKGIDLVNHSETPQDDNGHGTRIAGIAAAESNNAIGISGVNWHAKILPVKVLDSIGNGSFSTLAQGIIWAVDHGSNIINLSLGGTKSSELLKDAINYAVQNNVMVVASSGNNGQSTILYPACYDSVLAVGAITGQKTYASFSNYGTGLDVVAPGENIYSINNGGGYTVGSGTSYSAPMVSGLAAILCGIIPFCPINQIEDAIVNSVVDLGEPGWDPFFGYGLIQVDSAIKYASRFITPSVLPTTYPPRETSVTPIAKNHLPIYKDTEAVDPSLRTLIPYDLQEGTQVGLSTQPDIDVSITSINGSATPQVNNEIKNPQKIATNDELLKKNTSLSSSLAKVLYPLFVILLLFLLLWMRDYLKTG